MASACSVSNLFLIAMVYWSLKWLFVVRKSQSYGGKADWFVLLALWPSQSEDTPSNVLKAWQFIALFFYFLFIRMWPNWVFVSLIWVNVYFLEFFFWNFVVMHTRLFSYIKSLRKIPFLLEVTWYENLCTSLTATWGFIYSPIIRALWFGTMLTREERY